MKITQIQPCILWKTTPVANPLHKPAHTLKHPNAHVSSTCQRFHRPQIPHQYHASTSPAHNQAKPSKIVSHEQKGAPIAAKNNGIIPPYAHERTELVQIANCERKGVSTAGENGKIIYPFAHERTKSARIASREQKGVSIEVENDENMHPFAHRRAKSNEIATREQEAAQTGQPETATLSGKCNPNGVATATKCGRSSRKPRAPTPQTTAHTRNQCHAAPTARAPLRTGSQAARLR